MFKRELLEVKAATTEVKVYQRVDRTCPIHLVALDEETLFCKGCGRNLKVWLVVGDLLEVLARVSDSSSTFYEPPRLLSQPVALEEVPEHEQGLQGGKLSS